MEENLAGYLLFEINTIELVALPHIYKNTSSLYVYFQAQLCAGTFQINIQRACKTLSPMWDIVHM